MIPRIDVRGLAAKKQVTGELLFEFEAVDLLDIPFMEFSSPVQAAADYEIFADNKVEVRLRLTFTLLLRKLRSGYSNRARATAKVTDICILQTLPNSYEIRLHLRFPPRFSVTGAGTQTEKMNKSKKRC